MERHCENCGLIVRKNEHIVNIEVRRYWSIFNILEFSKLKFTERICLSCIDDMVELFLDKKTKIVITKVKQK